MSDFSMIEAKVLLEQTWETMPYAIALCFTIDNNIKRLLPSEPQRQSIISLTEEKTPDRNRLNGVIIPGTRHKNQPADNSFYQKQAKFLFATLFGGFTAFPDIKGGWILEETGQLVEEPGFLVAALTTQAQMKVGERMIKLFALYLKRELDQDAIAIIIGGNLKFI